MLGDESFQLTDKTRLQAEGELGLDTFFERGEPQLVEPGDLTLCERVVPKVGERRAAPERERLSKPLRRLAGQVASEGIAAGSEQVLELRRVQFLRSDMNAGWSPPRAAGCRARAPRSAGRGAQPRPR